MIAQFNDHIYPSKEITHIRKTARALLVDEAGNFLFLHIKGKDVFGIRDHYESVGGGIEEGETLQEAILREVAEETGYTKARIVKDLGDIEDCYHLIQRKTISHFFVVQVNRDEVETSRPTLEEATLFQGVVWMKETEVESMLRLDKQLGLVGELVHRRDLCAFRYYISIK